jgi:predicted Zn-dependent protease
MSRSRKLITFTTALLTAVGCAVPRTNVGTVSQADVKAEQQEQLRLAGELAIKNQDRVDRLAIPLLRAAAPLCGSSKVKRASARSGSASLIAPADPCPFRILVPHADELNAASDGSKIYVATALLRFASDDELSVVLAHEIAHNAMRHRDAQMRNMLGGAVLGALADIAMAAGGRNTGGRYTSMGAEAGAKAFSQDFEREADYIGMYILAWAGRPLGNAATFWRRMAVEHPTGIVFGSTHPTTAERFVRLEQWTREIEPRVASGEPFGPEMRDQRNRVVSLAITEPTHDTSAGEVLAEVSPKNETPPLGMDASPKSALSPRPSARTLAKSVPAVAPAPRQPEPERRSTADDEDERYARATIGAPRSEADRDAAVPAFERGKSFLGSHDWARAKSQFKLALQLDGSVAAYHAALGEVLMVEEDWAGAAAEFTAALLLDVDNDEYRTRLREARARR